jgi:hypothetical protein
VGINFMKISAKISLLLILGLSFAAQSKAQTFQGFVGDSIAISFLAEDTLASDTTHFDFRAAAILPFFTQLVVDTVGPPPRREWRMREIAVDHLNGVRWAADRLASAGYHVEINLFDEIADSMGVYGWGVEDVVGMDVVMGPLQQSSLSKSLRTVEKTGAEHIILTKVNPGLLTRSDHLRSVLPSVKYSVDILIEDILENHPEDNIIFVMAGGADAELEAEFLEKFPLQPLAYDSLLADTMTFDTVMGAKNSIGSLPQKLQFYDRNVIVSLAGRRSRSMISNMQMAVQVNDSTDIYVYANSDLKNLGFIDIPFLERTRTTIPQSGIVDWGDSTVVEAVRMYRDVYDTDPSEYAVRAHDTLLDAFIRKMEAMPMDTALSVDTAAVWAVSSLPRPVATDFNWAQVGEFGGYVNSTWELSTFNSGRWCKTDTVPALSPFVLPELDEEGLYIRD